MQHPCPGNWEYELHPKRKKLGARVEAVLKRLRLKATDRLALAKNTRPVHGELFEGLTPAHFTYYAGNYRGAKGLRCLETYHAGVQGDPRVGAPPAAVAARMGELIGLFEPLLVEAESRNISPSLSPDEKKLYVVRVASFVFDLFLQIHPYANGNGHLARFITWAVLGHFGYWPVRWKVDPRPDVPNYVELITRHRAGDHEPLVFHLLSCIP